MYVYIACTLMKNNMKEIDVHTYKRNILKGMYV